MAGCALHLNCGETVVHRLLHARLLRLSIGWMLIGVGAVITPTPVPPSYAFARTAHRRLAP